MTDTILPHELASALDRAPESVKVLSLDCFDTLLWRDCHEPVGVFAALDTVTTGQRIIAEQRARRAVGTLRGRSEVSLDQIYTQAMPNASRQEREAALSDEIAAESSACFAFAPTVDLMRAAKARGLKVVIVSDTYLDEKQLLELIAAAAGEEVAGLIDRVFASSVAGISKGQGLLAHALKAMKCAAHEVFHIGDNRAADYDGARAFGIPALHLLQFSEDAKQRLRLERACQRMIGEGMGRVSGPMPHRALVSEVEPQITDEAERLGFTVLGPVFAAFDQWLRCEAAGIAEERGGKVHWLFMLRDGHLPHIIHQAGGEAGSTARVEISRFVAIAATLTTREAYQNHFALEFGLNPATLARQMLLDDAEIAMIVGEPQSREEKIAASERLRAELRKGQREKLTRRRSRARAERLVAHVKAACDPQPGDTLMLVDLGYNGSAQDRVDGLLAEAFDCHVAGRYLLLREMAATGLDKRGLIDARHYDGELLEALCGNVAVIEQLATCAIGSVSDFDATGAPIREEVSVKGAQSAVRERVQDGVVRFARAAQAPPVIRKRHSDRGRGWREAALGVLTRFMFLPLERELDVLKSFEHDVNLGSERMVALFDEDHARAGMRRRGLFYMKGSERMFLPAELAREPVDTRLSLMAQKRFGLALSYSDSAADTISIPAIYVGQNESAQSIADAGATHEGFYTARLPVPDGARAVALQVGSVFDWLEFAGAHIAPVADLQSGTPDATADEPLDVHFDGAKVHAAGIVECTDAAAFALVNVPPRPDSGEPTMIEFTLRPLRRRNGKAMQQTPPLSPAKEAAA